jgi:(2S)-methylsuccinyl-CoA dehydrogenase
VSGTAQQTGPEEYSSQLAIALVELDLLRELVDGSFRFIKSHCRENNRFDKNRLDDFQLLSYDLAVCVAEISAAKSLLKYALKLSKNKLVAKIALGFAGDNYQIVLQRLLARSEESAGNSRELLGLYEKPSVRELLSYTTAQVLEQVGREITGADIARLPSTLDDEKELMRETFYRFTNDVVAPLAEEIHRQDQDIPEAIIRPAAELGCFGTCIPERFGGLQPDNSSDSLGMIVVTEELSRGSLGAAGSLITRPEIAARALLAGGTETQQKKWLPALAKGEILCAISITEPNTGSDVAAVSLKATPTKGGWLLNGSKTWCTFAGRSELIVVLARTNSDMTLGYKGLSLFLLQKASYPGHTFRHEQKRGGSLTGKAIPTLGYRGMHSYDLFFEHYFVPAENLVGEKKGEGKGFYYTMAGFSGGRIQTAARATGVMQAAYEKALSYANERVVFDKPLGEFQLTQVKLVRMLATITASRQFSYDVASLLDEGKGQMEASLIKLFACRAAEWITREAMQIHGGMGYAEENAVSRYFADARVLSIFEGTEEVLALKVIARELIAAA